MLVKDDTGIDSGQLIDEIANPDGLSKTDLLEQILEMISIAIENEYE